MSETQGGERTVPSKPEQWLVDYEFWGDEAKATIFRRIPGMPCNMRVQIAEVDCLPADAAEEEVVREGEDAERLQNVCLIVHSPELLAAVNSAARRLAQVCDGTIENLTYLDRSEGFLKKWNDALNTDENHDLWVFLSEIQGDLERIAERAVDLDTV